MPRAKEFDRDAVLRRAVAAFREGGFEGTSIQSLVDRMGIHRASLYDTYGSKEQLFREVLTEYERLVQDLYRPILELEAPAREVLARFFEKVIVELTEGDQGHLSCLMLKTALSGARNLADVPAQVRGFYDWFGDHFVRLLTRGRREGSVTHPASDRELATFLRQALLGLVATAAVDGEADSIRRNVEQQLGLLLCDRPRSA